MSNMNTAVSTRMRWVIGLAVSAVAALVAVIWAANADSSSAEKRAYNECVAEETMVNHESSGVAKLLCKD